MKLKKYWTPFEDEDAFENTRAFNYIYNGVDKNIFKITNTCTNAKEALETLEIAHDGTSKVIYQDYKSLPLNLKT